MQYTRKTFVTATEAAQLPKRGEKWAGPDAVVSDKERIHMPAERQAMNLVQGKPNRFHLYLLCPSLCL
jgi:hypothetical protein